jgi:hypothetical protein
MATLLGALESMKAKLEEDDVKSDDTEIEAAMIALMEAEQEVDANNTEIMELDNVVGEAEEAIGRLEGIRDAILEYGISKSMMKAVDPQGELCAAGIVASYEELEDTPVKDANAEAAVEGLVDRLKDMWRGLISILETIWNKLKSWGAALIGMIRSAHVVLDQLMKKVNSTAIDESALDQLEAKVYTRRDFDEVNQAVNAVFNPTVDSKFETAFGTFHAALESDKKIQDIDHRFYACMIAREIFTSKVCDAIGVIYQKNMIFSDTIQETTPKLNRSNQKISAAGYTLSTLKACMHDALTTINYLNNADKTVSAAMKKSQTLIKDIEKQVKEADNYDNAELTRRKDLIIGMKVIIGTQRTMLRLAVKSAMLVVKNGIALGKVALKAEKK